MAAIQMTGDNIISVKKLKIKRDRVVVLDIDDFNVEQGSTLALIGPNGAGKSTLLLALAGLIRPDCGQIIFQGIPVSKSADFAILRKNTTVVFQEPMLLNESVFKNVAKGLMFRQLSNHEINKRVEEALEFFGIRHLALRSAKIISGGEAKRVSLARAFAIRPKLILFDEAFNSLDPPSKETIINDLLDIIEETKTTAIFALHDREETLLLARNVAFIRAGRIVQSGTALQLFNEPADEFVANFVGLETILEGIVQASYQGTMEIAVNGLVIEACGNFPPGQTVYCCLRPENVTIFHSATGKTSARNIFAAKIIKIIRQGFFYKVILDCGFPLVAFVTHTSCEELGLYKFSEVSAAFKATAIHVIRRG